MKNFHGQNEIGFEWSAKGDRIFEAVNPATGESLPGRFREATASEVARACAKAEAAFPGFSRLPGRRRAEFLEAIADTVMERKDWIQERAALETAYPDARIAGERDRTVNQLLQFAALLREGSWVQARIDSAQPGRQPIPKPDIRRLQIGIGPVAVFGASNFPQAFSTAGGDTASALAAGCPVVYKAHPAHPGLTELYAGAIAAAARRTGMPDGVFSRLNGFQEVGTALVRDAGIQAVGFTGSYRGGRALMEVAAARPRPIPVFAEMGSSNPVFLLPEALRERRPSLVDGFLQSLTMGVGQFCTNPGLLVLPAGPDAEAFLASLLEKLGVMPAGTMVHPSVKAGYDSALADKAGNPMVRTLFRSARNGACPDTEAAPAVFQASARDFAAHPEIGREIFGPGCMVVLCEGMAEIHLVAESLEGQLTATVHGTDDELTGNTLLISLLERKAGRLILNGFPTGVEVCPSMHHGGPFPSASFPQFSSVGTAAIYRFTRPVCYQDFPPSLLPQELRDGNPMGIWRLVDGEMKR